MACGASGLRYAHPPRSVQAEGRSALRRRWQLFVPSRRGPGQANSLSPRGPCARSVRSSCSPTHLLCPRAINNQSLRSVSVYFFTCWFDRLEAFAYAGNRRFSQTRGFSQPGGRSCTPDGPLDDPDRRSCNFWSAADSSGVTRGPLPGWREAAGAGGNAPPRSRWDGCSRPFDRWMHTAGENPASAAAPARGPAPASFCGILFWGFRSWAAVRSTRCGGSAAGAGATHGQWRGSDGAAGAALGAGVCREKEIGGVFPKVWTWWEPALVTKTRPVHGTIYCRG